MYNNNGRDIERHFQEAVSIVSVFRRRRRRRCCRCPPLVVVAAARHKCTHSCGSIRGSF